MEEKYLPAGEQEAARNSPFQTRNASSSHIALLTADELSALAGSCTFCKEEKLRSKKLIDKIFAEGKSVSHAGFALYYYTTPLLTRYPMQAAFAVPKRYHRLAVNRNRIKRLMREVWRKNKMPLYMALAARQTQAAVMWMYRGKSIPDYVTCEQRMLSLIHKLQNALT